MPAISPEKLLERLSRGKAVPAIVLHGTDSYLREMCRKPDHRRVRAGGHAGLGRGAKLSAARSRLGRDSAARANAADAGAAAGDHRAKTRNRWKGWGTKRASRFSRSSEEYLASPAPFTVLVLEAAALDGRQKILQTAHREGPRRRAEHRRRIGRRRLPRKWRRTWAWRSIATRPRFWPKF